MILLVVVGIWMRIERGCGPIDAMLMMRTRV